MSNLIEQWEHCIQGNACLVGVGNTELGDDAFGVRLAQQLLDAGVPGVIVAHDTPIELLSCIEEQGCDHVIFLGAVEFGGRPGSTVLLSAAEIDARFPQVSTSKMSLGLIARWIEDSGKTKVWLLGVQPGSLKPAAHLTPAVEATLHILFGLLCELKQAVVC